MNRLHVLTNSYKKGYEECLWEKILNIYYYLSFPIDREVFLHVVVNLPLYPSIDLAKARYP